MKTVYAFFASAIVLVLLAGPPVPAQAQEPVGAVAFGMEAGLPLVFGWDLSYRVSDKWRAGLGFSRLSGMTALRAEGRLLLRAEAPQRLVPMIVFGAEQYFLKDADLDATPLGVHLAFGLDYHLNSPISIGARLGGLKTFGSSEGGDVKVFSVQNGHSTGMFNMGIRYHF